MNINLITKLPKKSESIYFFRTKFQTGDLPDFVCRLPPLSSENKKRFLVSYHKMVDTVSLANQNNQLYWYTAFAQQNIWHSHFYAGFESLHRLSQFLSEGKSNDVSIYLDDSFWLPLLKITIQQYSSVTLKMPFLQNSMDIIQKISKPFSRLKSVADIFIYMIKLLAKTQSPKTNYADDYDLIMVGVWFQKTLDLNTFKDPFFGDLYKALDSHGIKFASFSHILGYTKKNYSKISQLKAVDAFTYSHILTAFDVVKILFVASTARFKIPSLKSDHSLNVSPYIREDIETSRFKHMCYALLVEKCMDKVLKRNPKANILHMYEGHAWEFGCIFSTRKYKRRCLGYQHASVLPSHVKMRNPENQIKPMPDAIITTGEEAKNILTQLWNHDPSRTLSGGSLRQSDIYQFNQKSKVPEKAINVLILLQGLNSDYQMIRSIFSNFKSDIQRHVYIRNHPASPLCLDYKKLNNNPLVRVSESNEKNLYADLLRADVVIYSGSTAALEAIALGVPALHVNLGDTLSPDPLFKCSTMRSECMLGENVAQSLDALISQVKNNFPDCVDQSRKYYEDYFTNDSDRVLDHILNFGSQSPGNVIPEMVQPLSGIQS